MNASLGLGTVQFGFDYGISNTQGKPDIGHVARILAEAKRNGIKILDTAALYGESEEILGLQNLLDFDVVTKTPRFAQPTISNTHADELETVFFRSLKRLNLSKLYALLSHHPDDLLAPGGEKLWDTMRSLKKRKLVKKIGASVYDGAQVDALLRRYDVDLVQIPINVLDQRMIDGGQLDRLESLGIEIHARSVFLQGLLLMDEAPSHLEPLTPYLANWKNSTKKLNLSASQAALAFVRDLPSIDVVLVGVTNIDQLLECIADFGTNKHFSGAGLSCNLKEYIDPSKWRLK